LKIFFLLLVPLLQFAGDSIEKRIYQEIFQALFPTSQTLRVWTDSKERVDQIRYTGKPEVRFVPDPAKADILLVFNRTDIGGDRPVLIGRYSLLKVYGDRVVAGFYWKKGRPHLIFFEKGLKRYRILLPERFSKYLEKSR